MNVPYNNGKVQIGKYYQKPQYVEEDPDMIRIQGWLIGDNRTARIEYWANVGYCCLLVVAIVVGIICT
jgi:hypothetical protein